VKRVLYRLPELITAPSDAVIYVVEGEKDADRLVRLGLVATTNSGGAAKGGSKWPSSCSRYLKGRSVCIVPDNDTAGRAHAAFVATAIGKTAARVRILEMPGLADKGDVSDWLDNGGTVEQLVALAQKAGEVTTPISPPEPPNDNPVEPTLDINPRAPFDTARTFLDREFVAAGASTLWCHQEKFYHWNGVAYPEKFEPDLKAQIYRFLDRCYVMTEDGGRRQIKPNDAMVRDTAAALRAATHLASDVTAPAWLGSAPELAPQDILACRNVLLHLPTQTRINLSPDFFTHNAVEFAHEPDAPAPALWLYFLDQLWTDDAASIEALQEFTGYLLTPDTSQQKGLLIIGPKRSGKGTIARVLSGLIGASNIVNPTLSGLGMNFGLEPLIGKRLALISDAHLDTGMMQHVIVERLLSIIDEDSITVDRKYSSAWTGRLQTRFIIHSNELPRLSDASGALVSRFIVLVLRESFYGREDPGLAKKLLTELPAILNWAIAGWRRLQRRGAFVQPGSAESVVEELEALGSPIGAFIAECCIKGELHQTPAKDLFGAWCDWCSEHGYRRPGTTQTLGRDLRAAHPGLRDSKPRGGGPRGLVYVGIGLNERGAELLHAHRAAPAGDLL